MHELVAKLLQGNVRAAARVARLVDERAPGFRALLRDVYASTGAAWLVGVTGHPGAGKSTLVDRLVERYRAQHAKVGVVAVDPTSPFTSGAILGDRIRMQRHFEDAGVFIRSVATRGALGGLSRSASDVARVIEAWGAEVVLLETVGVGQDEIDVARTAHTTLVVTAPGLGDDVQANKAGILECADVLVVNKADRDGADAAVRDLELMLALGHESRNRAGGGAPTRHSAAVPVAVRNSDPAAWSPPVLKCVATRGEALDDVFAALGAHRQWLETSSAGARKRRDRVRHEIVSLLAEVAIDTLTAELATEIDAAVDDILARHADPYTASEQLLAAFRGAQATR